MSQALVTGLFIYPVKSCREVALTTMKLNQYGPQYDRGWMIVDENNQFLTLRTHSKLAEIKTAVQGSFLHLYAGSNKILVNLTEECESIEDVTIWGETFKAGIENKSINEALSDFLTKTVKLARYQKQSGRSLEDAATKVVSETTFTDSRPILLTNQASLIDLNRRLQEQNLAASEMQRFRPNIVIEGLSAYEEENAKRFLIQTEIGTVVLVNPKLCGRCPIITQEVETGKVVSKETLQTLASYRKKEGSSKIPFGVYLTPENLGSIKLGDQITAEY